MIVETLLGTRTVSPPVLAAARVAEPWLTHRDSRRTAVAARVLQAFADEAIDESDLAGSTGYGYDDAARERYESLLSRLFRAERSLARLSIVSGTHAIVSTLAAMVSPGALLLSAGRPYDTLRNAICDAPHSLVATGVRYAEAPLDPDGELDPVALADSVTRERPAAVFIQRSRGYASRRTFTIASIEAACRTIRATGVQTAILIDNCYGELVEEREPLEAGADAVMGSLIKNLGGGIAPSGGYVAGRAAIVERVAARLYAPGLGTALGPTLGFGRAFVQGLYYAPLIVGETLRGLDFAAALFAHLGYRVDPLPGAARGDIVQAIALGSKAKLLAFARGLQSALPLNARFRPEPGPVPGYVDPVVMSSGAFVAGATSELSCDAPLRPPFEVYLQGGISAEVIALGAIMASEAVLREGEEPKPG